MDASEIGVILMVAAVSQLFLQVNISYCSVFSFAQNFLIHFFVFLLQFFLFPKIARCLGFRHTYKLGCAVFGVFSILLPLSNRISGPASYANEDTWSGSGSGSGSDLTPFFFTYNDSCGNLINSTDNTTSISDGNSVSRVPGRVWVVIITIVLVMVCARYVGI